MKEKKYASFLNKCHMDSAIFIEGEPYVGTNLDFDGDAPDPVVIDRTVAERSFRFVRMFKDLPIQRHSKRAMIELGQALAITDQGSDHPKLPAGFTYLGQFVDHDITLDVNANADIEKDQVPVADLVQGRSPAFDLDSLYGAGPARSPELYEADGVRLKVGHTTPTDLGGGNTNEEFPNDLPRDNNGNAIIGDLRNDENLTVAQTHLAFIKFHNKIVDQIRASYSGSAQPNPAQLFQKARRSTTLHYQSIVLNDWLPRIVEPGVIEDIKQNGGPFIDTVDVGMTAPMPVEFAVAAYRLGHSLIRDEYEWNRVFQTGGQGSVASLDLLFMFTEISGNLGDNPTLPSNWIIDWSRFYDFSGIPGINNNPQSNQAHLIDTRLAGALKMLPLFEDSQIPEDQSFLLSLPIRNLLRGRLIGLPSGQQLADIIAPSSKLSSSELRAGPQGDILQKYKMLDNTPLWYYILFEAETHHQGQRLGPVGSRIVAETMLAIAKGSKISILRGKSFRPSIASMDPSKFTMVDLLAFVDDINPLGDSP